MAARLCLQQRTRQMRPKPVVKSHSLKFKSRHAEAEQRWNDPTHYPSKERSENQACHSNNRQWHDFAHCPSKEERTPGPSPAEAETKRP
eukprot:1157364-Pelagomonas_calceolata.AAC.4